MSKGVTFDTKEDANEYADNIRGQGLVANVGKSRKTGKFLVEIKSAKVEPQRIEVGASGEGRFGKFARITGKGLGAMAKSLATPKTNKRPKIAQMPGSRKEMGISTQINLENLKDPGLRGQTMGGPKAGLRGGDISGRKR